MKRSGIQMKHIALVIIIFTLLAILLTSSYCAAPAPATSPKPSTTPTAPSTSPTPGSGYRPPSTEAPRITPTLPPAPSYSAPKYQSPSDTIGMATGGAKDINNFRENIKNRYLPLPTDLTYEGLFYDYYFNTGETRTCNKLFCPSYSFAVTKDPFSRKTEYYLSVGLNSGLKESDFARKRLNLVVVLDISGSMSSPFNEYYYDLSGRQVRISEKYRLMPKLEVAKDAILAILDQLNEGDRLGIVLFDDRASILQQLSRDRNNTIEDIQDKIYEIRPGGGTNLSSGMGLATDILGKYANMDPWAYENRIIFLTDAMPNMGETNEYSLLRLLKKNADNRIYTTFFGIGVDFNTELIDYITKVKGANYYSVHAPGDFMERIENEFDYMVTPLVFNLRLTLDANGWDIEKVYGSPEADQSSGELMKVNTLFPSQKKDGETRGGMILLKLKKRGTDTGSLRLRVSYDDRAGNRDTSESMVYLESTRPEYFDNNGIRKGILLARYADLMKDWIIDEREHNQWNRPWAPRINLESGIIIPPILSGQWERQSLPLAVSSPYNSIFRDFSLYFAGEMDKIGDVSLQQELQLMQQLGGKSRD
jgi:Ca-activated chloride channel homolog